MKNYGLACFLILIVFNQCLFGQVEKVYDNKGMLRAINPINEEGIFEGLGFSFYDNGSKKEEIPYQEGEIHGVVKEFYKSGKLKSIMPYLYGMKEGTFKQYFPDSSLKMKQEWLGGKRNGPMEVFFQSGKLRIFSLMRNDSILFAQYFDQEGKLLSERIGYINQKIDSADLAEPQIFLEVGNKLQSGLGNRAQIIIPKVPSTYLTFESSDGTIDQSGDEKFPLIIYPRKGKNKMTLYVMIKLQDFSQPTLKKKLVIPVK
ncbi:MAG: hypothetical protein AAFY71_13760 [Bacteroidota bacterium]